MKVHPHPIPVSVGSDVDHGEAIGEARAHREGEYGDRGHVKNRWWNVHNKVGHTRERVQSGSTRDGNAEWEHERWECGRKNTDKQTQG